MLQIWPPLRDCSSRICSSRVLGKIFKPESMTIDLSSWLQHNQTGSKRMTCRRHIKNQTLSLEPSVLSKHSGRHSWSKRICRLPNTSFLCIKHGAVYSHSPKTESWCGAMEWLFLDLLLITQRLAELRTSADFTGSESFQLIAAIFWSKDASTLSRKNWQAMERLTWHLRNTYVTFHTTKCWGGLYRFPNLPGYGKLAPLCGKWTCAGIPVPGVTEISEPGWFSCCSFLSQSEKVLGTWRDLLSSWL